MDKISFNSFKLELEYDESKLEELKYDMFWDNSNWDLCRPKYNLTFNNLRQLRTLYNLYVPQSIKEYKREQTSLEKFGYINASCSPDIQEKRRFTCLDRYKVPYTFQVDSVKETIKESLVKNLGVDNPAKSSKVMSKISKTSHSTLASDGTSLDSKWELEFYEFCLGCGLDVERLVKIDYAYNDKVHSTFIDFKVDDILFEVKGNHLLNGCFSYKTNVPIEVKLNLYKNYNVVIISKKDSLFDDNSFRGLDIDIFLDTNNQDKTKTWKHIKYLLNNYTGFISKELLNN